jgi:hypothetical protein
MRTASCAVLRTCRRRVRGGAPSPGPSDRSRSPSVPRRAGPSWGGWSLVGRTSGPRERLPFPSVSPDPYPVARRGGAVPSGKRRGRFQLMHRVSRRDVVCAAVVVPAAASLPDAPPLSAAELRVLAMTATPDESWDGRAADYARTRVFSNDSDTVKIAKDLEVRGLVLFHESRRPDLCNDCVQATPAGLDELRRLGVDV